MKKCPNCGNVNPMNYGVKFEQSHPIPQYKCKQCGTVYQ